MNPRLDIEGRTPEQREEQYVLYLQERGYVVRPPLNKSTDIKTPAGLVKFFYNTMAFFSPQTHMVYVGDQKKDLSTAKKFIEVRRSTGVNRQRAITECCELIGFLFKFEGNLGLNFKVTSMSVLGQGTMAWFTEKLISAYNGLNKEVEDSRERLWLENMYNEQELNISKEQVTAANLRLGLEENDG